MSNKQQREEHLSALLDSELSDEQLESFMQDLKADPIADAEAAQRYRLMGDAMRDELDQSSFMDISGAVHRAIEQEPAHTESAELAKQSTQSLSSHGLSSQGLSQRVSNWFSSLTGPLTGVAVAASVAMVTLVTFNAVQNTDEKSQSAQLAQSVPVVPVSSEIARNVQVASTLNVKPKSAQQQELNRYMLEHSGYASQSTLQGMMPYVRAADVNSQQGDTQK